MKKSGTQQKSAVMHLFRLTILVVSVFLVASQLSATRAFAALATLAWAAPTTYTDGKPISNLSGYKIYTGTVSGSYSQNIDIGNTSSYTLSNLNDATTYYFAVKAYDASGNVSNYSNQVAYTTPAAPPPPALYTLTASAGSGGSITPSGSIAISQGLNQTFTISPTTGYKIAGVTVDGASVGAVSSYTFSAVTSNHTIQASFTSASAGTVVAAINSGGSQYKSSTTGVTCLADTKYIGGTAGNTTTAISGTVDDTIYQSERYGNFSYSIPVVNGNYNVTLKFVEFYFTAAGKRVFSVKINGQTVISNLDLYAKVGKNTAYDVVTPVSVTNGVLSIQFVSQVNNAKVSGILVSTR